MDNINDVPIKIIYDTGCNGPESNNCFSTTFAYPGTPQTFLFTVFCST